MTTSLAYLSSEQRRQCDCKGKAQDTNGPDATGKEEEILERRLRWFVGFNGLLGKGRDDILDNVRCMDHATEFDAHAATEREVVDVVIEVVKHAVTSVDLRVQLSNHGGDENHVDTNAQKDGKDPLGKIPKCGSFDSTSGLVNSKDDKDDHELTTKKVAIKSITSVSDDGALVRNGVTFLVEFSVNRRQTNQSGLSSFNDTQPKNCKPQQAKCEGGVDLSRQGGLAGEDQTQDESNGEGE
jgi:hypothetical protein